MLREAGHNVYALTLTGLGERAHLASPEVDLHTHIRDVTAVIEYEDLERVTLVGHSYGGIVITGVAAAMPERLAQLVYIDATLPEPGQAMVDTMEPGLREFILKSDVVMSQPPPIGDDMAWWREHATPHPLNTWRTPIPMLPPEADALPRTFIACTGDGMHNATADALRTRPGWRVLDIATDHFPMYRDPVGLTALLLDLAK
jgi:pimeloyl-ACP methyl ester carboxylesterase